MTDLAIHQFLVGKWVDDPDAHLDPDYYSQVAEDLDLFLAWLWRDDS